MGDYAASHEFVGTCHGRPFVLDSDAVQIYGQSWYIAIDFEAYSSILIPYDLKKRRPPDLHHILQNMTSEPQDYTDMERK